MWKAHKVARAGVMRHLPGMSPPLSPVAELVRRHDPDRFLTALFAPPERRETLFVLYAFNHELARAREVTSEPTLALIRLQWWREVVEGARRRHEVAGPLGEALDAGRLAAGDLLAMIEGREMETDPVVSDLASWRAYLTGTAGALAATAGRVLGAGDAARDRLRALGAAYGVTGQWRSVLALARQGRCLLPEALLGAHGLTVDAVLANPLDARLQPFWRELAAEAACWLAVGKGDWSRDVLAAGLPAVLARRDARRMQLAAVPPSTARGFGDRAAVVAAALLGRI